MIYGYAYVPPTPFRLKDWERYDVSRYADPDALSPEEGWRTTPVSETEVKYVTIKDDLERFTKNQEMERAIFLFHVPPYQSKLDQSARAGQMIDHVPLDTFIGSIAVRRFIESRQPLLTLHGHVHESARLSGSWRDRIGRTQCFSAAHDGPELALVRFDPDNLDAASRELI
jgi:Icc-related predicted phosphoesterase